MSLVSVTKKFNNRAVSEDWQTRRAELAFTIQVDDYEDGSITTLNAASEIATGDRIPKMGEAHPEDDRLVCINRNISSINSDESEVYWFEVTCQFSTRANFPGFPSGSTDYNNPAFNLEPENREAEFSFGSVFITEPVYYDNGGVLAIPTNLAGDPFDPQPVAQLEILTFDVTRYEAISGLDMQKKITAYKDAVNDFRFGPPGSGPAEKWKPNQVNISINAQGQYISGRFYWRVNYHLEFRVGFLLEDGITYTGWQPASPEMGWNYKNLTTGKKVPFVATKPAGDEVPRPVLGFLASDGTALNGDGTVSAGGDSPTITMWPRYTPQNFDLLGLYGTGPGTYPGA